MGVVRVCGSRLVDPVNEWVRRARLHQRISKVPSVPSIFAKPPL